jgi:hypothetical protein
MSHLDLNFVSEGEPWLELALVGAGLVVRFQLPPSEGMPCASLYRPSDDDD